MAASVSRSDALWFDYLVLMFELVFGNEIESVAFPDVESDAFAF